MGPFRSGHFKIIFGAILLLLASHASLATQPRYELQTIGKNGDSVVVRVVSTATHRAIWSRHAADIFSKAWSRDHRSLAISWQSDQGNLEILLWKVGGRVQIIHHLPIYGSWTKLLRRHDLMDAECLWGLNWSPDSRRLLFLWAFSQGPVSVGMGMPCVLNIRSLHVQFLLKEDVGKAVWIGRRKILFTSEEWPPGTVKTVT